jgi:hypothetical protein
MEACLEAGVRYTDLGGLFHTMGEQPKLHDRRVAVCMKEIEDLDRYRRVTVTTSL